MRARYLWDRYWFRPIPILYLGILRVTVVGYQLYYLISYVLDEMRRVALLPDALYDALPVVHILLLPFGWHVRPPIEVLEIVYGLTAISGFYSLLGFYSKKSLVVFALGNLLLQGYIYSLSPVHHAEAVVMISLAILVFSPAGASLSFDELRRKMDITTKGKKVIWNFLGRKSRLACWPLLLIQWVLALIYLSAAFLKMKDGGLEWMNGYTLQYYFVQTNLIWQKELGLWLSQQHYLVWLLSWISIMFESSFFVALLFPPLAFFYVLLGTALHIGIYYTMGPAFFQYIMLYVCFLPWMSFGKPQIKKLLRRHNSETDIFEPRSTMDSRG